MAIGSTLPDLGLLLGRSRSVKPRNVGFLLGLGLHLAFVGVSFYRSLSEHHPLLYYFMDFSVVGHDGAQRRG